MISNNWLNDWLIDWLLITWLINSKIYYDVSILGSRRNFDGRVLSIISVKISSAIFDFTAAEDWGEK